MDQSSIVGTEHSWIWGLRLAQQVIMNGQVFRTQIVEECMWYAPARGLNTNTCVLGHAGLTSALPGSTIGSHRTKHPQNCSLRAYDKGCCALFTDSHQVTRLNMSAKDKTLCDVTKPGAPETKTKELLVNEELGGAPLLWNPMYNRGERRRCQQSGY